MPSEYQSVWLLIKLNRKGWPFEIHGVFSTEGSAVTMMDALSGSWSERHLQTYEDGSIQLSDGGWESTLWIQPEIVHAQ